MSDPYKILGVSPNATDEEVKNAYRALAKKYHPDNYSGSPIADLATEKMKEVNEAYDSIVSQRRKHSGGGYTAPQGGGYTSYASSSSEFSDVRNLIMSGRLADAEQILDGVLPEGRSAEWYFLKGTVLYKRGWLEEAYNDFSKACQMDPGNAEYRAAVNQAASQRNGMFGGYNPNTRPYGGCSPCDVCSTLICADCCCDCAGGGCC